MDKWLAKFKENNIPETPDQGTDITDNKQKIDGNDTQPRQVFDMSIKRDESGIFLPGHPEPPATPATLFKPINDELCRLWQAGTREWIEQHRPELAQEIDQAETRLNAAWLDCEDGTGDLATFKEALATWRQANLKAIRGYNGTRALGGVIVK
jgi:hypothetical protein